MGPRENNLTLRLSDEERVFLNEEARRTGKPISFILRQGLDLYFQNVSDCELKKKGIKVWKE